MIRESNEVATKLETEGKIDPLSNLKGSPVWIYSSTNDKTVDPAFQKLTKSFYDTQGAKVWLEERQTNH
jgi:predicted esterase